MCGIVGMVSLSADVDVEAVERARDVLAHRGPDGGGLWMADIASDGSVALAHRRLSILDLSARSDQPLLLDREGHARPAGTRDRTPARLTLVFNGEIYNYVELREELRRAGERFDSDGDTEVLLRAYARWGADCLGRLNGMFAFAMFDADRQLLFCARDRFGEKPFHYVLDRDARTFVFGSEVKALVAGGAVRPDLDARAVYRYFRFGEQAGSESSVWRCVRRLPAAHALTLRSHGDRLDLRCERYWELDPEQTHAMSERDALDGFGDLFRDSVRLRLRADVPVGTSLSGGLDSSSVLCQVHALGAAGGQRAFSARMNDPALDEGPHIAAVLARTGVRGAEVWPTRDLFLEEMDRLFYHQEEPFSSTSIFSSYLVHRLAADHGVTVMLDGQGADEYLAGYAHYGALVLAAAAREGRLLNWWRERRAQRRRTGADSVPPRAALLQWLVARRGRGSPATVGFVDAASFLTPDVHRAFAEEEPTFVPAGEDALKGRLHADLGRGHLQELLRFADRNSMAFSREVRLPFLDHRLVEFCLALPTHFLFRDGESKWILRRALRGLVPDAILDRRDKIGFATPWASWWRGRDGTDDGVAALRARLAEAELTFPELVRAGSLSPTAGAAIGVMALASVRSQLAELAVPATR